MKDQVSQVKQPMIRRSANEDTDSIIRIWLDASRLAHDFIPFEFWAGQEEAMRNNYLPNSETYVLVHRGQITAFISLMGEYLAALFVTPALQGHGFGKRLLNHAKTLKRRLELCVYTQNTRAVDFYKEAAFITATEMLDPKTGQEEFVMEWKTDRT